VLDQRIPEELTVRRAGQIIAVITLVIAIGAGLLMRVVDRHEFPSFGSGLWWSIQTVTTVGYGDHVPTTTLGQLVAVFVMVSGLGFLSVVTATITAMFVESARRRRRSPSDITLDHIMERLDQIEALMDERLKADQRRADGGDAEGMHDRSGPRGAG
jgi:voltage-gated potassium channel Kch